MKKAKKRRIISLFEARNRALSIYAEAEARHLRFTEEEAERNNFWMEAHRIETEKALMK